MAIPVDYIPIRTRSRSDGGRSLQRLPCNLLGSEKTSPSEDDTPKVLYRGYLVPASRFLRPYFNSYSFVYFSSKYLSMGLALISLPHTFSITSLEVRSEPYLWIFS